VFQRRSVALTQRNRGQICLNSDGRPWKTGLNEAATAAGARFANGLLRPCAATRKDATAETLIRNFQNGL